jgi:hypothetical protein
MSTGREGHTLGTSLPTLPHLLGSHDMPVDSNVGGSRLEPIVNYIFGNLLGQYLEPFPGFSILVVILVVLMITHTHGAAAARSHHLMNNCAASASHSGTVSTLTARVNRGLVRNMTKPITMLNSRMQDISTTTLIARRTTG